MPVLGSFHFACVNDASQKKALSVAAWSLSFFFFLFLSFFFFGGGGERVIFLVLFFVFVFAL